MPQKWWNILADQKIMNKSWNAINGICRLGRRDACLAFTLFQRQATGSVGYWQTVWNAENVYEIGWSVLPSFQGKGIATHAVKALIEKIKAERKYKYIHAFPSINNPASNAICRKLKFNLISECEFEYPPGSFMQCNDWCLELESIL